nr:MAG: hypothetical protein [Iflaviridae sp.]
MNSIGKNISEMETLGDRTGSSSFVGDVLEREPSFCDVLERESSNFVGVVLERESTNFVNDSFEREQSTIVGDLIKRDQSKNIVQDNLVVCNADDLYLAERVNGLSLSSLSELNGTPPYIDNDSEIIRRIMLSHGNSDLVEMREAKTFKVVLKLLIMKNYGQITPETVDFVGHFLKTILYDFDDFTGVKVFNDVKGMKLHPNLMAYYPSIRSGLTYNQPLIACKLISESFVGNLINFQFGDKFKSYVQHINSLICSLIETIGFIDRERAVFAQKMMRRKFQVGQQIDQYCKVFDQMFLDSDREAIRKFLRFPTFRKWLDQEKPSLLCPHIGYMLATQLLLNYHVCNVAGFVNELTALGAFPFSYDEIHIERVPHFLDPEEALWLFWLLDVQTNDGDDYRVVFHQFVKLCKIRIGRTYNPMKCFARLHGAVLERLMKYVFCIDTNCATSVTDNITPKMVDTIERMIPNMDIQNVVATSDNVVTSAPAAPEGDIGLSNDQQTNTTITGGDEDKEAEFVEEEATHVLVENNVEDRAAVDPTITDRWIEVANFSMTSTSAQGDILSSVALPITALEVESNAPPALLFKQYEYCIPHMEVKVISNCSKQQLGAAGVAFIYGYDERDRVTELLNLATLSSMPNVVLNGSFATSVKIDLPYQFPLPVMPIAPNNWFANLNLGRLVAYCITPVSATTGNPQVINYRILVSLEKTKFFGQRGFYLPIVPTPCTPVVAMTPNMLSLKKAGLNLLVHSVAKPLVKASKDKIISMVSAAEDQLIQTFDDVNRDAPTTSNRTTMFQTSTIDMAAGVGPKSYNVMRLNPVGTTQHAPSDVGKDLKFDLDAIKQCYGLEAIFNWDSTMVQRQRIFETQVQLAMERKATIGNILVGNVATPADNLGAMFQTYRGTLRYKFIFIVTGFHTGKLKLTFEPGVNRTSTCDLSSIPFAIIDLGASLEANNCFGFDVPYQQILHQFLVADPSAPYSGSDRYLSGVMSIFVENPLVAPSTVPSSVQVLVYKKCHENFEFGIPRNNLDFFDIGELFDTAHMTTIGIDTDFNTTTNLVGSVTARASGYTPIPLPIGLEGTMIQITFTPNTPWTMIQGYEVSVAAPLRIQIGRINQSRIACNVFWLGSTNVFLDYWEFSNRQTFSIELAGVRYVGIGIIWTVSAVPLPGSPISPNEPAFRKIERQQPNMLVNGSDFRYEDAPEVITLFPRGKQFLPLQTGGEKQDDLKSILRRQEMWHVLRIPTDFENVNPLVWNARIPVSYGAPIFRDESAIWMRNNRITKMHDMYRFTRGSIRWVIAATCDEIGVLDQTTMTVGFIPLAAPNFAANSQIGSFTADCSGYATQVFSLRQNNINTIEFPHYTTGRFTYNSSFLATDGLVNFNRALGVCYIRFSGPPGIIKLMIYRALGDDVHMYLFNGCPNRNHINFADDRYFAGPNGTRITPFLQADGWKKDLTKDGDVENNPGPALSRMLGIDQMNHSFENIEASIAQMRTTLDRSAAKFDAMADSGSGAFKAMEDFITRDERFVKYTDIALQIAHVINNPTMSTFVLSLTSIMLKVIPAALLMKIPIAVSAFCERIWRRMFPPRERQRGDNGDSTSACNELWSMICDFFGVKSDRNDGFVKKAGQFFRFASIAEKIAHLLEIIIDGVKIALNRLYKIYDPEGYLFNVSTSQEVRNLIKEYVGVAGTVTNPECETAVKNGFQNSRNVFKLYKYGELLRQKLPSLKAHDRDLFIILERAHADVKKLCTKVIATANRPLARREPFCLYIFGAQGLGKSFECDKILFKMLETIDAKVHANPIFTKNPGTEFFDGWDDTMHAIKYDDFNAINKAEPTEMSEFLFLKSNALYTGNFADVVDKQRTVHPKILALLSNEASPKHNDVKCLPAINRRRDIVLAFSFPKNFAFCDSCAHSTHKKGLTCKVCRSRNAELIEKEEHITCTQLNPMTCEQMPGTKASLSIWKDKLVRIFSEYYEEETKNYLAREKVILDAIERTKDYPDTSLSDVEATQLLRDYAERYDKLCMHSDRSAQMIHLTTLLQNKKVITETLADDVPDINRLNEFFNRLEDEGAVSIKKEGNSWTHSLIAVGGCAAFALAESYYKRMKRSKLVHRPAPCICKKVDAIYNKTMQASRFIFAPKEDYARRDYIKTGTKHKCKRDDDHIDNLEVLTGTFNGLGQYVLDVDGVVEMECDDCKGGIDWSLNISGWRPDEIMCLCQTDITRMKYTNTQVHGRLIRFEDDIYYGWCGNCKVFPVLVQKRQELGLSTEKLMTNGFAEGLNTMMTAIRYLTGLLTVIGLIKSLWSFFNKSSTPNADSSRAPRPARTPKSTKLVDRARNMRANMQTVNPKDLVFKNLVALTTDTKTQFVIMVRGHIGIMTRHGMMSFEKDREMDADMHGQKFKIKYADCKFKELSTLNDDNERVETDLAFIVFPMKTPSFRDIVVHFAEVEDLENFSSKATFVNVKDRSVLRSLSIEPIAKSVIYDDFGESFLDGVTYDFREVGITPDYTGLCMSPLIDELRGKVFAFHVCSDVGVFRTSGSAQLVTREILTEVCDEFEEIAPKLVEGCVGTIVTVEEMEGANIMLKLPEHLITRVVLEVPVRHSTVSAIKRSPMFGILSEPEKVPVVFQTVGELYPGIEKMRTAIAKNKPDVEWGEDEVDKAMSWIMEEIITNCAPPTVVKGYRSTDDAILGVPNVKTMPGMDLSTSTGFPLNYVFTNKKQLITVKGEGCKRSVLIDKNLRQTHEANNLKRVVGQCPETVFHAILKDELKTEEKRHNPRLIQAGPVEYTIACRRLTMDFTSAFYHANLKMFSAVGMNCLGKDWQTMTNRLKYPDNVIAGDVKSFGPTLPHYLVKKVYHIINRWYDTYDKNSTADEMASYNRMRNVLREEITSSHNVAYDVLFETLCCSPSGQPLTVVVNTICMYAYLIMAWNRLATGKLNTYDAFKTHVNGFVYGDDIIMSVSSKAKFFNNNSLKDVFADVGIVYTDNDKKDKFENYVPLEKATFLGRSFKTLEGRSVGALDESVINNIVNWTTCKSQKNIDGVMMSCSRSVLIEMLFQGKEKHDEAYFKLSKYWNKKRESLLGYTYNEMVEKWKHDEIVDSSPVNFICTCPECIQEEFINERLVTERSIDVDSHTPNEEQNIHERTTDMKHERGSSHAQRAKYTPGMEANINI